MEKFFYFTLLLGTENLCAMAAGLWVSSMSSTVEVANAIAPALNIVFTLFNGFLINVVSFILKCPRDACLGRSAYMHGPA